MRVTSRSWVLITALPIALAMALSALEAAPRKPQKTAQPPDWKKEKETVFFDNAFEKLVGSRPDYKALAAKRAAPAETDTPGAGGKPGAPWSKLISRETLEDEVKSFAPVLAADINVPAKFSAGGYRKARRHFTALAAAFAVIAQYDRDVRWKQQAAGLREVFAKAGFNAKAGSVNVYNEAKARRDDLTDLIRGGSVTVPDAPAKVTWSKVADFAPLMMRFETAYEKRLQGWVASEAAFKSNIDGIKHEAEILAMLGRAIQQDGFELADDEDYQRHAVELESASRAIVQAVVDGDHAAAQKAAGRVQLSCTNCHGDFR